MKNINWKVVFLIILISFQVGLYAVVVNNIYPRMLKHAHLNKIAE